MLLGIRICAGGALFGGYTSDVETFLKGFGIWAVSLILFVVSVLGCSIIGERISRDHGAAAGGVVGIIAFVFILPIMQVVLL